MNKILNVYKPIGLTPLQLIFKLRTEQTKYKDLKIGFAGRLDPLAHGVMLLMIGDETKNRAKYLNLDKEYEFEVLFGVSTDTYDALGLIHPHTTSPITPIPLTSQINKFIKSKIGKQTQLYPPYSSKTVNGKPLYQWARENRLSEIKIPEREIEIYSFKLVSVQTKPVAKIRKTIVDNINSVDGDFRQKEILGKWKDFFSSSELSEVDLPAGRQGSNNLAMQQFNNFSVAKFKINCSSGTYVRSLANELGEILGSGAIALDILRTRVGKYSLKDSLNLEM